MSRSVLVLLVVGGLLILLGAGWRVIVTRRSRRQMISLLTSPDPATRVAVLAMVATEGIERFASTLRRMSENETAPAVLDALAEAVNRTQAMPARSSDLITLRLWAAMRVTAAKPAARPGLIPRAEPAIFPAILEGTLVNGKTGRHRLAPPDLPGSAGMARIVVPFGAPVPAAMATANGKASIHAPSARPAGSRPAPAPRERERATEERRSWTGRMVLVTGAGGPAGVAVIRALRRAGHRVVAADADRSAVGLRLADEFAHLPRADDPAFADGLVKAVARSGAAAVIPTVAEELAPMHAAAGRLRDAGAATWLPDPRSVERCVDKWLFHQLLTEHGIAVPATGRWAEHGVPGPWIVKPRFGRGSRDVYNVDNETGLSYAMSRAPEPLVQTRITGREFTVDTLSGEDGRLYGAVPRWRTETKAGISTKGVTFEHAELVGKVAGLLGVLRLAGPACVQGFLTEEGKVVFIEVNPRFSGGLPLSLAAGADLVGEYLNRILGGTIRPERLRFRPGVMMLRYFDEVFQE